MHCGASKMIRLTVFFEVNISWVVGRDLKGQNDSA